MPRLPLVAGSHVIVVNAADDVVVLRPPTPREAIADVAAAVRDALRFPLSGPPLETVAVRGGRATVVVEARELPLPGAPGDPRRAALESVLDELERLGVPQPATTILLAGGLGRRAGRKELEALLSPHRAREFRGAAVAHDCEGDLLELGDVDGVRLQTNRLLADTHLIVVVSAAESVVHGGPATLLAAGGAEGLLAAGATSLLETATAAGWRLGVGLEQLLAARVPLFGVSLVLNHPRMTGAFRGYPYERASYGRVVRSGSRRLLNLAPGSVRRATLQGITRELTAVAAYGGPPSVAHAEALVRGVALRGTTLERPLDALVVPIPWKSPHQPRGRQNPVTVAATGLGLALRLWRDAFPVADGGTVVLLHRFSRSFEPEQHPYRQLFAVAREAGTGELALAADAAGRDERMLAAYRAGRACHPLLPYHDWESCRPALERVGAVVIAGCRDAQAARTLGFVPTHGMSAALAMAYGRAPADPRVGFVVGPPYAPLLVGSG